MNYKEFTKKLRAIGCREMVRRGGGSHRKWFNPTTERGTTIPDWGQKDLKTGTISAVCRQLGIDRKSLR
jgi:mRNA interferase HicA